MGIRNLEKAELIHKDERVTLEASFDTNIIFVQDVKIIIEEGDFIGRKLPSGNSETYIITRVVCYDRGPSPHYELSFEKQTALHKNYKPSTVFNIGSISGYNVNVGSTDNSANYTSLNQDYKEIFNELATVIREQILNNEKILNALDELERSYGTNSFSEKYNFFIQTAAAYMTIISPFLPTLSTMAQ